MANRFMNQFYTSLEKGKTVLFGKFSVGAVGAATIDAVNSKGIASIVRGATAGKYTITLQDVYNRFLGIEMTQILASGTPAAAAMAVVSESVASTKTIVVQFQDFTGAAVEVDSGAVVLLEILLKNSSAQ